MRVFGPARGIRHNRKGLGVQAGPRDAFRSESAQPRESSRVCLGLKGQGYTEGCTAVKEMVRE
jgi:hypothetical protein